MGKLKDRTIRKVISHRISVGRPNNPTLQQGDRDKWLHALDYFEITGVEQDKRTQQFTVDQAAMARLEAYGIDPKKPRRIPVRLYSDDIWESSFDQRYRSRAMLPVLDHTGQPKMVMEEGSSEFTPLLRLQPWCDGDGEEAFRLSGKTGERDRIPCHASPKCGERPLPQLLEMLSKQRKHEPLVDTLRCPWAQNSQLVSIVKTLDAKSQAIVKKAPVCKPETTLIVSCDVVSAAGSFARFRSHGHHTADTLRSSLEDIKERLGFLAWVPLDLVLQMKHIDAPFGGKGKLQPVVHAELRMSMEDTVKLMNANLQARLEFGRQAKLLEAARAEVETEEVDGEFTVAPLSEGGEGGGGLR